MFWRTAASGKPHPLYGERTSMREPGCHLVRLAVWLAKRGIQNRFGGMHPTLDYWVIAWQPLNVFTIGKTLAQQLDRSLWRQGRSDGGWRSSGSHDVVLPFRSCRVSDRHDNDGPPRTKWPHSVRPMTARYHFPDLASTYCRRQAKFSRLLTSVFKWESAGGRSWESGT